MSTLSPSSYIDEIVPAFVNPDGVTVTPISAANPQPVQPAYLTPTVMTLGTAYDFTKYRGSLLVQVDSLSGGDVITFAGSVASGGTLYPLQTIINTQTGAQSTNIAAAGVYQVIFAAGQYVTATKTGSTYTAPTITVSGTTITLSANASGTLASGSMVSFVNPGEVHLNDLGYSVVQSTVSTVLAAQ
jgi:hypothetical protein